MALMGEEACLSPQNQNVLTTPYSPSHARKTAQSSRQCQKPPGGLHCYSNLHKA